MNLILRSLPFLFLATPPAFAAVTMSMGGLVEVVVALIIAGVIFGLLILLVRRAPFIPPEWKSGIEYVIIFIAVLIVINILLGFAGYPLVNLK